MKLIFVPDGCSRFRHLLALFHASANYLPTVMTCDDLDIIPNLRISRVLFPLFENMSSSTKCFLT